MKGRFLCASQASTAVCSSKEKDHIHKSSTTVEEDDKRSSSRAIDRHNPIIKDGRRSFADGFIKLPASNVNGEISNKKLEIYKGRRSFTGRKSTGSCGGSGSGADVLLKLITNDISLARKSFNRVARPACDFVKTPIGCTRYLLGSDPDSIPGSAGQEPVKIVAAQPVVEEDKTLTKDPVKIDGPEQQTVVLKVSLHCRGCEGKVRKHLAKMQGVTSFNIEFAAKKLTVTGNITPLEILDSISKVKKCSILDSSYNPKAKSGNSKPLIVLLIALFVR